MNPLSYRTIIAADLCQKNSQLYNRQFTDIYHHNDAIAESQYVFHTGNHLQQQWQDNNTGNNFVIAETGFGSGLNFLTTRQLWQATAAKPKHLHFISTEQWLLTPEQLDKSYQSFPDLHQGLVNIRQVFQQRRAGFHCHTIDQDITLYLLLGDATACFRQLNACVDAWFLDGFSPAKNPAMWSLDLFTEMARLSRPGSTFATFTAASQVRKNLQAVGFEVSKTPGFQGKRERLVGRFKAATKPHIEKQPWAPTPKAMTKPKRMAIIGGGIAGLCLAQVAKQHDLQVTVFDEQPAPLSGASGNAYALVMPYLTAQSSPEALFYWRAFETAVGFYPASVFNAIGVSETTSPALTDDARLQLPADLIQAAEHGFNYPSSGFIHTRTLADKLSTAVDTWRAAQVTHIEQNSHNQWLIHDDRQKIMDCYDVLIIAGGIKSLTLLPEFDAFMTARKGQTELYQLSPWPSALNRVQLNNGYLIPNKDRHQVLIGGDYQHLEQAHWFDAVEPKAPSLNLNRWQKNSPCEALTSAQLISTHAGIRANSLDHLPLCGPVVDTRQFSHDYADLHHGRHWQHYPPALTKDNLYVMTGLGSRGYTTAPLLANHLMAMILDHPLPLEQDLVKIVHPNRFYYRQLKKAPED